MRFLPIKKFFPNLAQYGCFGVLILKNNALRPFGDLFWLHFITKYRTLHHITVHQIVTPNLKANETAMPVIHVCCWYVSRSSRIIDCFCEMVIAVNISAKWQLKELLSFTMNQ